MEVPVPLNVFAETIPASTLLRIVNATGTTPVAVISPLLFPIRVDNVYVTNNDAIAHVVSVLLNTGSGSGRVCSANVPAGAGFGGVVAVDVLAVGLPAGQTGIVVASASVLSVAVEVTVVGAFIVAVNVVAGGIC
jgi:hypothetical protein